MKPLNIAPNIPLHVALKNPEGDYDFDLQVGRYETTTGQLLTLPRPAVILLNALNSRPGEELQIVKGWSGKAGDGITWTVALANSTEKARAEAGEPDTLTEQLERSLEAMERGKAAQPTPIRKPAITAPAPAQPKLFDRGTGTHGPAPMPIPAPAAVPVQAVSTSRRPSPIPVNIAIREILQFVAVDPNTKNWSDQSRQDLASTILIAEYKQGRIGLWERGE